MKTEYITATAPLEEIAKKKQEIKLNAGTKELKVVLDIPAFQRGLVWNPAQVEALWDSVLRGIPIGTITLIPYAGERGDKGATHGVFDGQQRLNAISLGYKNPFDGKTEQESNESILWLDLMPQKEISKSRKFHLYLTTPGQPWGYKMDDSGTEVGSARLSTSERCAALNAAGACPDAFSKPACTKMWPFKAQFPVPLSVLLKSVENADNVESFKGELIDTLGLYKDYAWYKHLSSKNQEVSMETMIRNEMDLQSIFDGLKYALNTRVVVVISPHEFDKGGVHGEESAESDVAVFFSRLNRGGSVPSVEEVNYSVLKSIVPSLKVLDTLAGDLMQPARLATIAMRLYLTEHSLGQSDKDGQWRGNVSKKDVIKLASCKDFEEFVTKNSEGYFQSRVRKLLCALKYCENNLNGMPPYVLSTFISKFPDMFLLFLTMKEKACSAEGCSAFMLMGTYGRGISYKDAYESSKGGIHRLIHDLAVKEQILVPPPVEVYADMETVVNDAQKEVSERLRLLDQAWNPEMHKSAVDHVWGWHEISTRMLLLYACRRYLGSKFQDYNPAAAVWKEDNCPWDYDHIFPQSWVIQGRGNAQGKCHSYVFDLINSIGNIAPVPFSFNRSKNNGAPYDGSNLYTNEVKDDSSLFADVDENTAKECSFMRTSPVQGSEIEKDENATLALARIVIRRTRRIYEACYNSLGWGSLLETASNLDERCVFFNSLIADGSAPWNGVKPRIWSNAYTGKQVEIEPKFGYLRGWLACGVEVEFKGKDGKCQKGLACVCCGHGKIEWGIRRHPDDVLVDGNPNVWWIPNYYHAEKWGSYLYKQKQGDVYQSDYASDLQELVNSLTKPTPDDQT